MRRPLVTDEIQTVINHTWAGIRPSGEQMELNRVSDFYGLPSPTPRQLLMGVYCAAGRWIEPNNHIINSLLTNFSLGFKRDELTTRLPALLGGLTFAIAFFWLCASVLKWSWAAPLVALWAWYCPYVLIYSQTARGYSWMLAIQVLMIIQAYRFTRRPTSILENLLL